MKKYFFITFFILLFIVSLTRVVFAGLGIPFGGRIISAPQAKEIIEAESAGFICAVEGTTFNIKSLSQKNSTTGPFLIPVGTKIKGIPSSGKLILGLYTPTPIPVTCTDPIGATTVVMVYPVTTFGVSRR
ncbi:hypothetical protein K8Q94_03595 [Candidatus Nomurabacteria bacterium]|nr:hypothetical protein [Candidatus Nomurabacteria bacterium]